MTHLSLWLGALSHTPELEPNMETYRQPEWWGFSYKFDEDIRLFREWRETCKIKNAPQQ
tara:strand:+ start:4971 stop:5147 length:177 start_codon:yes stop_codon:yes gene_type:complete